MSRWIPSILLALFSSVVMADNAGSVVLSLGSNTAQLPGEESRMLKRKSPIFTQDSIVTGEKGRLQLKFSDGSRLALTEKTLFKVEEYLFDKDTPEKGKSVYRLLKGGMRTITGAISSANTENYRVNTPIATIGVRGTNYELFFCDKSCADSGQEQYGLFGKVLEGTIFLDIGGKITDIQSGSHFYLNRDAELRLSVASYRGRDKSEVLPALKQQSIPAMGVDQGVDPTQRDNYPRANGQYPRSP